ncbi:MAG: hypothetical protein OHK0038_06500 [Flammeovirgaceae bacterium]
MLSYHVNKEFITERFCINKSKPQLDCNGKCFLKKQLDIAEKQENSTKISLKVKIEIPLLPIVKIFQFLSPIIRVKTSFNCIEEISSIPLAPIKEIFHPPLI